MKLQIAGIFTALSTTLATPALAQEQDNVVFYTNPDLIQQRMTEIGCDPLPEEFEFEHGKSWEEQTIPINEQRTRSRLIWYCTKNQNLANSLNGDTTIAHILEQNVEQGILAMRSLPEEQRERADAIFRELAVSMAREALEANFVENLEKHPALPGYYNELSEILDQIEEAGNVYQVSREDMAPFTAWEARTEYFEKLDSLHHSAFDINMELQERGFKSKYWSAAYAVAMSAAVGTPPNLALDTGSPSKNAAWIALNETYYRMKWAISDQEEFDVPYGRDYYERKSEKIEEYTINYFSAPEFGN